MLDRCTRDQRSHGTKIIIDYKIEILWNFFCGLIIRIVAAWLNPYHADDNYYAYCKLINFDIIMGGALYS